MEMPAAAELDTPWTTSDIVEAAELETATPRLDNPDNAVDTPEMVLDTLLRPPNIRGVDVRGVRSSSSPTPPGDPPSQRRLIRSRTSMSSSALSSAKSASAADASPALCAAVAGVFASGLSIAASEQKTT
eukprot:8665326-Pyramimonas_sp.AAC.1